MSTPVNEESVNGEPVKKEIFCPAHSLEIDERFKCWADVVKVRARQSSDSAMLVAEGRQSMTYSNLAEQVDSARASLAEGCSIPGARVATAIRNGPELATLFVSVMCCTTVVPLNPSLTRKEFETLLRDIEVDALIVEADVSTLARPVAVELGLAVFELTAQPERAAGSFELNLVSQRLQPEISRTDTLDVALVLLTSGTTSKPKRVPLTHRNLIASATSIGQWYALGPNDRSLAIMPFFHIQGLLAGAMVPLITGGSAIIAEAFDGNRFFSLLDNFAPTWYTAGPTYHKAVLTRASLHSDVIRRRPLRFIRSSSAPLAPQTMAELEAVFYAPVLEGYGLTETCMHAASNPLPPASRKPGCVGVPVCAEFAIADETGSFVDAGITGEVILRGPAITSGYEKNPLANDSAFYGDWFRTGDQGYVDSDGYLILTGRFKEMINRGGENIAPVEIDHALLEHPDINEAVAFSIPHPTLGEDVGVAIVRRQGSAITEQDVQKHASASLASFKVPRTVLFVDTIPKSNIGKSLRLGLAESLNITSQLLNNAGAPPQTEIEKGIADIWQSLLATAVPGVDTDFFALGGDSLQAVYAIDDIERRFGVSLDAGVIFDSGSTVAGLAKLVEQQLTATNATKPGLQPQAETRASSLPASYPQRAFWILSRMFRSEPLCNVTIALELVGPLSEEALEHAIILLARRHEALRTELQSEKRELVQLASDTTCPVLETEQLNHDDNSPTAIEWARRESQKPFDVTNKPLWRASLLRRSKDSHILLFVLHHSISDGTSCEVLAEDLLSLYARETTSTEPELPSLPLHYADFSSWQRRLWDEGELASELEYWRTRLEGAPAIPKLPQDIDEEIAESWCGRKAIMELSAAETASLQRVAKDNKATLFMVLLAGYFAFLNRCTLTKNPVVGVPFANRNHRDFERVVGCFMNVLPLRVNLRSDSTLVDVLKDVRQITTDAYVNQRIPKEILSEHFATPVQIGDNGLFESVFQLRNYQANLARTIADLSVDRYEFDNGITTSTLNIDWELRDKKLRCSFTYQTKSFANTTIESWLTCYREILGTVSASPAIAVSALPAPGN